MGQVLELTSEQTRVLESIRKIEIKPEQMMEHEDKPGPPGTQFWDCGHGNCSDTCYGSCAYYYPIDRR